MKWLLALVILSGCAPYPSYYTEEYRPVYRSYYRPPSVIIEPQYRIIAPYREVIPYYHHHHHGLRRFR